MKMTLHLSVLFTLFTTPLMALETLKVQDGKVATCSSRQDFMRNRLGAYTFAAQSVKVIDHQIVVTADLKSYQCLEKDFGYTWAQIGHLESTDFLNPLSDHLMTSIPQWAKLRSYRDGIYKLLVDKELSNDQSQITMSFDLEDFLNETEKELLERGEVLLVDFDTFLLKSLIIDGSNLDAPTPVNYGLYRVRFTLSSDDQGTLNAKML